LADELDEIAEELGALGCRLMELEQELCGDEIGHIVREIGIVKDMLEEKANAYTLGKSISEKE